MDYTDTFLLSVKVTYDDEIFGLTVCAEEGRKSCFSVLEL